MLTLIMMIKLRDWEISDLKSYEHWQKPGHLWQSLDGPYYKTNVDESKNLALELQTKIENQQFSTPRMSLAIADIKTNELIGRVSSYWESKETNWLCIGIVIYDDACWGRGIGKEALS